MQNNILLIVVNGDSQFRDISHRWIPWYSTDRIPRIFQRTSVETRISNSIALQIYHRTTERWFWKTGIQTMERQRHQHNASRRKSRLRRKIWWEHLDLAVIGIYRYIDEQTITLILDKLSWHTQMFRNSRQMAVDKKETQMVFSLLFITCWVLSTTMCSIQASNETTSTDSGTTATHGRVTEAPAGKPLRPPWFFWKPRFVGWAVGKHGRAKATSHGSPNLLRAMCRFPRNIMGT